MQLLLQMEVVESLFYPVKGLINRFSQELTCKQILPSFHELVNIPESFIFSEFLAVCLHKEPKKGSPN